VLGVQNPTIRLTIVIPNRGDGVSVANTICKDSSFRTRIDLDRICEVMRLYVTAEAYRVFFIQMIAHLQRCGIVFPKSN
jgi:hypothetical protein